ncbi:MULTISPECIES: hypothetical protein [Flavobacterium]|uniref:Uncharacterized protein n=1 Tax=Flavobacterium jumunjinense TaxID=998845 RepID=A0ABV5GI48_9FLAO|nr:MULTISPECIES: hypothetical protein [Flavobacterium]
MEAYMKLLREQNPEIAKYLDLMQPMMENKEIEVDAIVETKKVDPELQNQINKLKKINRKLFTIVEGLKVQLELELNQNDDLAKAIGACLECFGENSECSECFGTGKPGVAIPDFILFNKYINPAIQKYNKHYFNKN